MRRLHPCRAQHWDWIKVDEEILGGQRRGKEIHCGVTRIAKAPGLGKLLHCHHPASSQIHSAVQGLKSQNPEWKL